MRSFRTVRGTKAEAERVLNGMLLEAEMGGKELSPRLLLGDFMQRWLKERVYPRLRSQTCRWYERTVRLYLLTAAQIAGMEARLAARGVSPSVLYHCRRVLSVVVNYALKLDLIRHNPLRGLDAVVYERQEPATPDVESVSKLLDHVRSRNADYYALFRLVAYTGMRIGEVLALRWTEVDFDGRYWRVLDNLGLGLDGRFEVNSPKSRAGRRRVDWVLRRSCWSTVIVSKVIWRALARCGRV